MYQPFLAYCDSCRKDVAYYIRDTLESVEIKERTYHFDSKVAYCAECGGYAEHPAVHDFIVYALNAQYRKENNLLSLAEILEICSLYNLEPRTLSKLLNWDETPFSVYYEGTPPDYEISEQLRKLRYDPQHFLEILEENKEAINPITYAKTKAAVQRVLERNFKNSKLYYACLFFIEKKVTLHKHSLQKLLYYTQGFSQLLLG